MRIPKPETAVRNFVAAERQQWNHDMVRMPNLITLTTMIAEKTGVIINMPSALTTATAPPVNSLGRVI